MKGIISLKGLGVFLFLMLMAGITQVRADTLTIDIQPQIASTSNFTLPNGNLSYRIRPAEVHLDKYLWVTTNGLVESTPTDSAQGNLTLNFAGGTDPADYTVKLNGSRGYGTACLAKVKNLNGTMVTVPADGTPLVLASNATAAFSSQIAIVPLNTTLDCKVVLVSSP